MADNLFLPNIIRMCTEEERRKLIATMDRFIKDGKWTGAKGSQNRAVICMRTKRGNEEADAGMRKKRKPKDQRRLVHPQITFQVPQIVLIKAGYYPMEDEEASHLCHNTECILLEHLVWERGDYNRRRKFCVRAKKCICRLTPPCMLNVHNE